MPFPFEFNLNTSVRVSYWEGGDLNERDITFENTDGAKLVVSFDEDTCMSDLLAALSGADWRALNQPIRHADIT